MVPHRAQIDRSLASVRADCPQQAPADEGRGKTAYTSIRQIKAPFFRHPIANGMSESLRAKIPGQITAPMASEVARESVKPSTSIAAARGFTYDKPE